MAVKLVANYSKRLGLPGYSSHQFSVSVETELVTTDDVAGESQRLYELLQASVDEQIQSTGFVPGATYGMDGDPPGNAATSSATTKAPFNGGPWSCSDKQRELLLKLVEENQLDKHAIEALSQQRFNLGVVRLNRLQMSGLLDLVFDQVGGSNSPSPSNPRRPAARPRGGGR
jgi:hypothetical protein